MGLTSPRSEATHPRPQHQIPRKKENCMNTPNVRVSALSRLQDAGKEQLRTVQHYFDRRHLEASLASLVQAASGHERRGLAPGSALYLVLSRESQLLTTAY